MWKKVDFDNMSGKELIHGKIYTVRSGSRIFKAVFNYCETEYWWACPLTLKEVVISEVQP